MKIGHLFMGVGCVATLAIPNYLYIQNSQSQPKTTKETIVVTYKNQAVVQFGETQKHSNVATFKKTVENKEFVEHKELANATPASIVNQDQENGHPLVGGVFIVTDPTGKQQTITGDVSGKLLLSNLKNQRYTIQQIQAPKGYEQSDERLTYHYEGEKTEPVSFFNKRIQNTVVVTTYSQETQTPLSGATYQLKKSNESIGSSVVSDEFGKIVFEELEAGTYKLEELKAPDGYQLESRPIYFQVEKEKK